MNTFSRHNLSRRSLVRILTVAAIVMISSAPGLDGLGTSAAVRLPEEAMALEPWLLPSTVIPAVVDTEETHELAPPAEAPRRTAAVGSAKAVADRARRTTASRLEKRALAQFMGLVGASGEEQPFMRSFEIFQSCRKFVAINC